MPDYRSPARASRLAAGVVCARRLTVYLLTAGAMTTMAACGTSDGSSSAPATCRAAALTATISDLTVATGNVVAAVQMRNASTRSCTLYGYPRVTFANAAGQRTGPPLLTTPGTYAGPQLGRAPEPVRLTLALGARAVSWISWSDMPVGSQTAASCIRPTREIIDLPSQSHSIIRSQHLNTVACGSLTVEPFRKAGYAPNPNQLAGI
jgi:hypothetical protein